MVGIGFPIADRCIVRKHVIITKMIETALYTVWSHSMLELSEFERTQRPALSAANMTQPPLVMTDPCFNNISIAEKKGTHYEPLQC